MQRLVIVNQIDLIADRKIPYMVKRAFIPPSWRRRYLVKLQTPGGCA
jgi:hypothetical protein